MLCSMLLKCIVILFHCQKFHVMPYAIKMYMTINYLSWLPWGLHWTATSCECEQVPIIPAPPCAQCDNLLSFPKQDTWLIHTGPKLDPNWSCLAVVPFENPSSLQTIVVSMSSHPSSHIVPQVPWYKISTLPCSLLVPPTSLTWVSATKKSSNYLVIIRCTV